eukprot:GCRY01000282.1.p1 GENE.GCRY01000282.1~~GCRY01000282.1.p1  ORF type:complete len:685 (+),score=178.68 GCRY01000282.1:207-2261(+)
MTVDGSNNHNQPRKRKRSELTVPTLGKEQLDQTSRELLKIRKQLPVYQAQSDIIRLFDQEKSLIVVGETGSGKTTQIPQFLFHHLKQQKGYCGIAVTQPRRVAAISIAQRVAAEMGTNLGDLVGYSVRFEDFSSPATRIKYLTDGMLLREAMLDPLLKRYKVVILDEAHERTLQTDILFGLIRQIMEKRADFKVIVMSATLEAEQFSHYFGNAKGVFVYGRQFPVDVFYTPTPEPDYVDAALTTILQLHMEKPPGDILTFLTGQDEIETLQSLLQEREKEFARTATEEGQDPAALFPPLEVIPLYAALPPEEMQKAFAKPPLGTRKVILATNIAETSVTISGIRYVIDTGVCKSRMFQARGASVDSLQVTAVSQAQARQRAGRAGREAAGQCYRLYTEQEFLNLHPSTLPEILRTDMSSVVLQMMCMGVKDVRTFPYMDQPPREAIAHALSALLALAALEPKTAQIALTPLGRQMARFPLDPPLAKTLLAANELGCVSEVLSILAMLSTENVFHVPRHAQEKAHRAHASFAQNEGDIFTLLHVFNQFTALAGKKRYHWCSEYFVNRRSMARACDVRAQLAQHCVDIGFSPKVSAHNNYDVILQAMVSGFFMNSAVLTPTGYRRIKSGQDVKIHPSSVMHSKRTDCVCYITLMETSDKYMKNVFAIQREWLLEAAPLYFSNVELI